MKKVAILGAGFCGLACCWHLLNRGEFKVDLFDPKGPGGESALIAAGLLHQYSGAHAKLNRFGHEGKKAAEELLKVAAFALNDSPIISKGILRLALTEAQGLTFASRQSSDLAWLNTEECQALAPGAAYKPGLLVSEGLTIDCQAYLTGLWLACERLGADFYKVSIESLEKLETYDLIIAALGAKVKSIPELSHLPVSQVKGQLLQLEWPVGLAPLQLSLNTDAYISSTHQNFCLAGSTYERKFASELPDPDFAKRELLPKIAALFPPLAEAKVIDVRAGLRASAPNHLPLIGQFGKKLWAITGMGSKGLLYHAYYAKKLVDSLDESNLSS